ncbi:hypothetical protein SLEP1_g31761 [Rubroshorea leprosula]|uniref:Uncharacterized protein n=1 Tax=Rubroshorea leprosula TaxID=152421 RepID=A0AAV5K4C4_9ROSI|nr:hypothetical protein SLEP1_g31761 [Rubroshorea leprosula]
MSSTFLMRMARTASRSEVLEVEEEEQRFLVVEPAPEVVVGQWTTKAEYIRSPVEKGEEEEWKRRLKGLADSGFSPVWRKILDPAAAASEFTSDGAFTAGHVHQHAISFARRKFLLFVVAAAVNAEIISITNATELL